MALFNKEEALSKYIRQQDACLTAYKSLLQIKEVIQPVLQQPNTHACITVSLPQITINYNIQKENLKDVQYIAWELWEQIDTLLPMPDNTLTQAIYPEYLDYDISNTYTFPDKLLPLRITLSVDFSQASTCKITYEDKIIQTVKITCNPTKDTTSS